MPWYRRRVLVSPMPRGAMVSLVFFSKTQPDEQADMILKQPKPMIVADICPSCGGTGKAVRPHPKNVIRLSVPDCQRCKGAGRMKPY